MPHQRPAVAGAIDAVVLRRDRPRMARRRPRRDRSADAHAPRAAARRLGLRRHHVRADPARGEDRHRASRRAHRRPRPHGRTRSEGPYEPLDDAPMLVGDVDVAGRPRRARAGTAAHVPRARGHPAGGGARSRARAVLPRPRQPLHDLLARRDAAGLRARGHRAARDGARAAAAGGADPRSRRPRRAAERGRPRRPQRRVDHRRHARASLPRRHRLVRLRPEARHRPPGRCSCSSPTSPTSATAGSRSGWTIGRWHR